MGSAAGYRRPHGEGIAFTERLRLALAGCHVMAVDENQVAVFLRQVESRDDIGRRRPVGDVEVDLVLSVLRDRGRIVEVPVTRRARSSGQSHLRTIRDGTRIAARIGWKRLRK